MRKIILFSVAAAGLLLGSSCQKIGPVETGGNVSFEIQTPMDAVTKAIGNGENVDIVHYEIYKAESGHANSLVGGTPLVKKSIAMSGKTATLHLNLLEDQNYVALFWAQVDGRNYYDVADLRNVGVIYPDADATDEVISHESLMSNAEDRAAFYQKFEFNTSNDVNEKVTLYRPFAQLNIGTTKESLNIDYPVDVTASKVTVTVPATVFNVSTGLGHTPAELPVVFALATDPGSFDPKEELEVNGVDYEYVAMNYFLVSGKASSVDVEFDIETDKGTVTEKFVAQVPVQRNYRTNIIGNLLTKETKFEIVVDNRFAGDWNGGVDGGFTEVPNPDFNN